MRIIFETPPTAMMLPQGGRVYAGEAVFRVTQFDPDEDPPPLPTVEIARRALRTLADRRLHAGPGNPLVATPDPQSPFKPYIPPVVIPEAVLATLAPGAKLFYEWRFSPKGNQP